MTLTRRGRIVRNIATTIAVIPLALLASLNMDADAAPLPVHEPGQVTQTVKAKPEWRCKDKAARILHEAGFRGNAHRIAWAITYRESKHQNLDESSPWYSGALGMWQIQTSAHAGKPWWSRAAMLDPLRQSKIVYRWSDGGRNWQPWGLTRDGNLDTTQYGGWSSWQHENWIMAPFRQGLALYPCKTLPPKDKR